MLTWLFLACAVIGGTVLVCQFVLTLVGLGTDVAIADDFEVPHDVSGGDAHFDGGTHAADGAGHDAHGHHGSSWLFGIITFRTLVAASTFFGLAGLAAESAGQNLGVQLLLAGVAGLSAMYGVHWIVQTMGKLGEDATLKVRWAIGQEGTVYVPIPAARARPGMVQLRVKNRLVEYEALTDSPEKLATGTKVRVVGVLGTTLEVEPANVRSQGSGTRSQEGASTA
jgi:membrane protein implicated in regulation of membrane protease activity